MLTNIKTENYHNNVVNTQFICVFYYFISSNNHDTTYQAGGCGYQHVTRPSDDNVRIVDLWIHPIALYRTRRYAQIIIGMASIKADNFVASYATKNKGNYSLQTYLSIYEAYLHKYINDDCWAEVSLYIWIW